MTVTLTIDLTDLQAAVLGKFARDGGTTIADLLTAVVMSYITTTTDDYGRNLIHAIPDVLAKATEEEKATLLAQIETILTRVPAPEPEPVEPIVEDGV